MLSKKKNVEGESLSLYPLILSAYTISMHKEKGNLFNQSVMSVML